MKKMTNKNANKLFQEVSKKYTTPEIVQYTPFMETFDVEVYTTIDVRDKMTLVDAAYIALTTDADNADLHCDCILASMIIEYLTNIPVPMVKNENGEEEKDLAACYEIVFGRGGLYYSCQNLEYLVRSIRSVVDERIYDEQVRPIDKLANKILDLLTYGNAILKDINENPATQENFLNKVLEFMQPKGENDESIS